MKKFMVISLGGSLIVPEKMDSKFLIEFVKTLRKFYKKYKFVIVCGGGTIARKYITTLKANGKNSFELTKAGVRATRMNAQFMMQMFGKEANDTLPKDMKDIEHALAKNNVVICGALRYEINSTTDNTAAKLAHHFKSTFINLTNVAGLYNKNPKTHSNAKLIQKISWKDFAHITSKIKFEAGQSFVLDQNAAKLIKKHKIPTFILGPDVKNIQKAIQGKTFKGTVIQN